MGKKTNSTNSDKKKIATMVNKISTKTVYGKIKLVDIMPKDGKPAVARKLMRAYGIAKRIITGTTTFGEYIGFAGSFEAINLQSGERFASGKCFLPNVIADMLSGEFTKEIESIRFAFDVSVTFDESVPVKYVYSAVSLIKPQEDNPIALLAGEVEKSNK